MNQPIKRFFDCLLRNVKTPSLLLLLSLGMAALLVKSSLFWQLVFWLPRAVTQNLVDLLSTTLSLIRPIEVHEQEAQIEFFIAWFLSGIALGALYLLFFGLRAISRRRTSDAS